MANSKSFLSVPKIDSEEIQNENTSSKSLFARIGRRISMVAHLSSRLEAPRADNVKVREMPGNHRTGLFEHFSLNKQGLLIFKNKMEQYKSRVFRYQLGQPSTIVCEAEAVSDSCCNTSIVYKEPVLGHKTVNLDLIGKHIPCAFTNDFVHSQRKAFIISYISIVTNYYLLPTLVEVVPFLLKNWECEGPDGDLFEERITKLVAAIYSWSFLGIELDYDFVKLWSKEIFKHRNPRGCKDAYRSLFRIVENCPRYEEMQIIAAKYKIKRRDMINEVIFTLLYNAIPLTSYALNAAIGRMSTVPDAMKEHIRVEGERFLGPRIHVKSVAHMCDLENFILEVVRLNPPAPLIFGVVRSMYILFSSSGNFTVNEGDVVVGNLFEAHRDPEIFTDPCKFNPSRFVDECLKDSLLSFGGSFADESRSSNRKCPGQNVAMIILKICLLTFMECNFKLKEKPVFEKASLNRSGRPDKPLVLTQFRFNLPSWWKEPELEEDNASFCFKYSELGERVVCPGTPEQSLSSASSSTCIGLALLRENGNDIPKRGLFRLIDREASSFHSPSLNSSLSEVNVD